MPTTVADQSAAVQAMQPDWALATVLMDGTRAMRAAGALYLPQWPNEDPQAYAQRLAVATLLPAYSRTVETMTAKPFSKRIAFNADVPAEIAVFMEDADLRGRHLHVFAADIFEHALSHGLAGIMVEFPTGDAVAMNAAGVRTQADERAAGIRPYLIEIKASQILGWRSAVILGVEKFTMLRLMESVTEIEGDFGTVDIKQVRVLTPGAWRTYRQQQGASQEWTLFAQGLTTLKDIPFVPVYGARYGFMQSKPPLVELAHMNVEHWQSCSDQQTILHVARVPILTAIGIDDDKFTPTVGASSLIKVPAGGDLKFVEHSGRAIEAGKTSIEDLQERMRQAGADLLVTKPQRVTAFQVGTENALSMCALQRITQDFQDALAQVLQIMADWIGQSKGGSVTLFNDFGASNLAEASAQLLVTAAAAGKISDELLFVEMQRRGMIGAEETWERERERIESQGPALGGMGGGAAGAGKEPGGNEGGAAD